jgi:5'-nucleotidase
MGRSLPSTSSGIIRKQTLMVNGQEWTVHAVSGSPAQAVLHGALEIMPQKPDLVVSGINYGENVGQGVTISGTVGAAMEAASLGIPALAISLEVAQEYHFSYSREIDFSALTASLLRAAPAGRACRKMCALKVEVPQVPPRNALAGDASRFSTILPAPAYRARVDVRPAVLCR